MGAVTALKYLQDRALRHSSIKSCVLDSPYRDLSVLLCEIVTRKTMLPEIMLKPMVTYLFERILEDEKIDLSKSEVMTEIREVQVPVAFILAGEDKLVTPEHGQAIYDALPTRKKIVRVLGGHNEVRPVSAIKECLEFLSAAPTQHHLSRNPLERERERSRPKRGISLNHD
jgi:hypothetical protein